MAYRGVARRYSGHEGLYQLVEWLVHGPAGPA